LIAPLEVMLTYRQALGACVGMNKMLMVDWRSLQDGLIMHLIGKLLLQLLQMRLACVAGVALVMP